MAVADTPKAFRQYAREVRRDARKTKDLKARAAFLKNAEQWERLARVVEHLDYRVGLLHLR